MLRAAAGLSKRRRRNCAAAARPAAVTRILMAPARRAPYRKPMPTPRRSLIFALGLALCGVGLAPGAWAADAFSSDWAQSLKSSARLIGDADDDGLRRAGIEIRLAPGAITYWRNPGDAGLPPMLSFTGSTNLAQASAAFPAPQRLAEGADVAFGYDRDVILPIDVKPIEAGKPVTLAVKLNYAVCEKICVPAQASLRLVLPAEAHSSPYAGALAAARSQVPRKVELADLGAQLVGAGAGAWRLCLAAQPGAKRNLFIEPPEMWWLAVKPDVGGDGEECFRIKLMQQPAGAALPVAARLTITGGGEPVETMIELKPGGAG
jgi:DsbC/DsbD-like thiol-disulfide interchange protein